MHMQGAGHLLSGTLKETGKTVSTTCLCSCLHAGLDHALRWGLERPGSKGPGRLHIALYAHWLRGGHDKASPIRERNLGGVHWRKGEGNM